jgi:hypothetical protein
VLATAEAAADDQTGGAMRIEQARYERQTWISNLKSGAAGMRCMPNDILGQEAAE